VKGSAGWPTIFPCLLVTVEHPSDVDLFPSAHHTLALGPIPAGLSTDSREVR
jgi:hypothetical protein